MEPKVRLQEDTRAKIKKFSKCNICYIAKS